MADFYGDRLGQSLPEVRSIIAQAAHGGTVNSAAKELKISVATLERRPKPLGTRPGKLLSTSRIRAYELRVSLGADPADALVATGWRDRNAVRKAKKRCSVREV